ncbi:hypothetical protein A0H81_08701 [Grifola frondosa]|uniref:BTB domain-containing protein n=1 Tax=Grifola frondosa TaxID=5627 RepID=A0A1C7M854_GRIFR|nr:hypothetical protein A0H81_08701 [Grifola frondosa]
MPFETITLNDGNEMPSIAFGTGWEDQDVANHVGQAIETGYCHIDTSQWSANEREAIRESALERANLFVTAKWSGINSIPNAAQSSLEKLGLKNIDLYLIHFPSSGSAINEANWREFEKLKVDGLVRSIGVSRFKLPQLQELVKVAKIVPAVNQISFNPYNYILNKKLLEISAQHGIVTVAYDCLTSITAHPGGAVAKAVLAAARRLNATPAQVLLSWARSKGVAILIAPRKKEHLKEYLAVADLPPLTMEEVAAIDKAGEKNVLPLMAMSNSFLNDGMFSLTIAGPSRDPLYYINDGNSVLLVENTLFKVHRSVLTKDKSAFETMFQLSSETDSSRSDSSMTVAPEGESDDNPIRLQGDTADEFRALLWALYALPHELMIATSPDANCMQLVHLVRITHKYQFRSIMTWALGALHVYYGRPGAFDTLPPSTAPTLPHSTVPEYPTLVQITELAALCERPDLLETALTRWKRLIGEGKDLALAITIGERFNLRSILGLAYHAMMLKGKAHGTRILR